MKRLLLILFISFSIFSCQKTEIGNIMPSENYTSVSKSGDINPHDHWGEKHYDGMYYVVNHPNYSNNKYAIYNLLDSFAINSNWSTFGDTALVSFAQNSPSVILNSQGFIKSSFYNSLEGKIPATEFALFKLYYDSIPYIINLNDRVEASLAFEQNVNNTMLARAQKERLLRSYAIYRHSTIFWNNTAPGADILAGTYNHYIIEQNNPVPTNAPGWNIGSLISIIGTQEVGAN
jgi:hypothetical protein